jgi:hypothetical protein
MTKESILKLVTSCRSEATEDDRVWFVAHPTREWRIRSPHPEEIRQLSSDFAFPAAITNFARMAAHIHELAEDPSSPAVSDMALCVLQIEKGTRVRVPALRDIRSGRFALVTENGETTTPKAMIAYMRASLMISKPVAHDFGDVCSSCGHPDETGDISLFFADAEGEAKANCLPCSYFRIKDGHKPTGTSIYFSKADVCTANLTDAHNDVKRLMDVVATGPFAFTSVLIDVIDKRPDLIRRVIEIEARR